MDLHANPKRGAASCSQPARQAISLSGSAEHDRPGGSSTAVAWSHVATPDPDRTTRRAPLKQTQDMH